MATETAKFALELEDKITSSAVSAEDGLKSLQSAIDKDTKALAQMKKAMRQMQAAGSVDIEAYRKLKSEIDATQEGIGKARAAFVNLGGDFSKIGKKAKKTKFAPKVDPPKGLDDILAASNALPAPLAKAAGAVGGVQSKITELTGAMGVTLGAVVATVAALTALAAILAAVAVATANATVALLKYAAAQADAVRSERLRLTGLGTLRRWMRLTAKDASQMSESINRVSERVPLARSQVAEYGQELHRLGIRGRAAEDALEALSIAQAVQGDLGRRRLMMLVRQAGHSEGAMRDLADRVRRELGGTAALQMQALSMIGTKLRESFQALFTGIDFGPMLAGMQRITRLFSQTTESGRAMRAIISTILTAFVGELADTTPRLEYFLKEMVILSLKVAIAFFRVKNAIERAFGRRILGRMLSTARGSEAIKIVLIALGLVVASLAAGVVFLGAVLVGMVTPFLAIGAAVYYAYEAVNSLLSTWPSMFTLFTPSI
ncbi:MAG: hypothetical protein GY700_13505 [Propionibacteriaceae bacterium]|nr:hypothetical protein [Propionibacteriaceae bacterium]